LLGLGRGLGLRLGVVGVVKLVRLFIP